MKTKLKLLLPAVALALAGVFFTALPKARQINPGAPSPLLAAAGLTPIGNQPVDGPDTAQLNSIFATLISALRSIPPSPNAGAQRRAMDNELRAELETFLTNNPASAWGPSIHLLLAHRAQLRCAYSLSSSHYESAYLATGALADPASRSLARQAGAGLAKMLVLTGRPDDFDALESQAAQLRLQLSGPDWDWAKLTRTAIQKNSDEAYKCGLYCMDQLGRLTHPGQFRRADINETRSSTNGFTAADLVQIAARAGLSVTAGIVTDPGNPPVPCALHLRSQHFIVVRERRGAFYTVFDPAFPGPVWLTSADLA